MIKLHMPEGQDTKTDGVVQSDHASPSEKFPRRDLFRRGAQWFRNAATLSGLMVLTHGMNVPENAGEYLDQKGPLRFVLGNHLIGDESNQAYKEFYETGDLAISIWNSEPLEIIDQSMREAKKRGDPYFVFIDGLNVDDIPSTDRLRMGTWLVLPHPDLAQKDQYPERIIAMTAETPYHRSYGLEVYSSDPNAEALQGLIDESKNWYDQPTDPFEMAQHRVSTIGKLALEYATATALLSMGMPTQTRRKVLGMVAGVATITALKNSPILGNLAGEMSSEEQQKFFTILQNTMDDKVDAPIDLWIKARTAMAVEKAHALSERHKKEDGTPQQVDMLYGSGHIDEYTKISTDPAYRAHLIETFMRRILIQFDTAILQRYPSLLPRRDSLLTQVASSFVSYNAITVNMPWGKDKIPPDQLTDFATNLLTFSGSNGSDAINDIASKLIKEFTGFDESL